MTARDAFRRELRLALGARTRLVRGADDDVIAVLRDASRRIAAEVAAGPSEFQTAQLRALRQRIGAVLAEAGNAAADVVERTAVQAGELGRQMVDRPLAVINAGIVLSRIDVPQVLAIREFMVSRIRGITAETAEFAARELGLVTIGAQTPFQAVKALRARLDGPAKTRAVTIVHTELARACSVATQARLEQAVAAGAAIEKQWLASGKRHPRLHHRAIHGQRRKVGEPFRLSNGIKLRFPHDPAAPPAETINCGCTAVPVVAEDNPYGLRSTLPENLGAGL